jgi:hypothetical protein
MIPDDETSNSGPVPNLFSWHGLQAKIDDRGIDLFRRLELLDCRNALTCIFHDINPMGSPFGGERCRLPLHNGRELCLAFIEFYDAAEDAELRPDLLRAEIPALIQHGLCPKHARQSDTVEKMSEKKWEAVERWQCLRIFEETPSGPPRSPTEERPVSIRLSRMLTVRRSPDPPSRPAARQDLVDSNDMDEWGFPIVLERPIEPAPSTEESSGAFQDEEPEAEDEVLAYDAPFPGATRVRPRQRRRHG